MTVSSIRPSVPAAARRPVVRAKAQAGELPTFPDAASYRNHVVKLVGQAIGVDRDLAAARRSSAPAVQIQALEDRQAALRMQLSVLRDYFDVPAAWSRPGLAFGEGFDKKAFWRDQDAALASGVVAPVAPVAPAAKPAMGRFSDSLENVVKFTGKVAGGAAMPGLIGFLAFFVAYPMVAATGVSAGLVMGVTAGIPAVIGGLIAAGKP